MSIINNKVSIIIPCFNQGKYIKEAIESALNQTYKNIEIVCVNDGSSDNSSEIIKEMVDKYKNIIFFDLEENQGVINARNMAIDASCGEYILPLDADDKIEPTYIEKAVEILNNKPEIGIVYCKARFFGRNNNEWHLPEFNLDDFLYDNCIFNCALFRKTDFYRAGKYKENMKDGCEDWDLWLSFIELDLKPYKIDEFLFNYRKDGISRANHVAKNNEWKKELFKNHLDLYLCNKNFMKQILCNKNFIKQIYTNYDKATKKYKKYKKLFKLVLIAAIIELIIIVNLLIFTN